MKKIVVLVMVFLLVGCNIEGKFNGESQVYTSDESMDLSGVVPSETTYDELLEMFGPADQYFYGERVFDVNDLPKAFYMRYDESLTFRIRNTKIIEMRIESKSVTYGDIYCGQSLDEALTYLYDPEEVLDGFHLYYKENVLYKNIKNQFDGDVDYYHDALNQVRIWSHDEIVTAIYYIGDESLHYDNILDNQKIGEGYSDSRFPQFQIGLGHKNDGDLEVINPFVVTSPYVITENPAGQMVITTSVLTLDKGTIKSNDTTIEVTDVIEFESDPFLLGNWLFKDFVYELDEFDVSYRRSTLNFIDLEVKKGGSIKDSVFAWTKGWMVNTRYPFYDIYKTTFQTIEGVEYLVLEPLLKYDNDGYFIFEREAAN